MSFILFYFIFSKKYIETSNMSFVDEYVTLRFSSLSRDLVARLVASLDTRDDDENDNNDDDDDDKDDH
jgi:CRISPR/Cas system endoribonuclease Cas6 (RAMP superfamily)